MHKKRETGVNKPTTAASFCLASQEECMPRCRENQSWMIPSAVLVRVVALQKKFIHSRKLSRNPGSMPNMCIHMFRRPRDSICVEFALHPQHETSCESETQTKEDFKSKFRKQFESLALMSLDSTDKEALE